MSQRYRAFLLGTLSFLVIIVAWELLVRMGLLNPFFTSSPIAILITLKGQFVSGILFKNLWVSLQEFAMGYGLGIIVGITLGVLIGWYKIIDHALDPFIWFLYSAPLISFYPLFVIWLGLGKPTVIAITFLLSVIPILVNTATGIREVSPVLVQATRCFGGRRSDLFLKVALPSSVPMLMAGLRLGIGRALMGVVIAEMFGATAGLGFSITYYGGMLQTTDMMASLIVVVALGVIFTQVLILIEGHFDSWRTDPGT